MVDLQARHTAKSQMGFQDVGVASYNQGAGDISFHPGITIFERIGLWDIPQGSVIHSATLTWNMIVKTQANTQSAFMRTRAHASGDSPLLRMGQNERANRTETATYSDWTASWVGGAAGDQYSTTNVTSILQELVNRSDWTPASYVTFVTSVLNENGSDMSVRANNDFVYYPRINLSYTPPTRDEQFIVNRCENSEFGTGILDVGTDGNTTPYWFQGDFFGGFVDGVNMGTHVRDTSFTRLPGIPTMRFTTGTPPAAPDNNKRTGPTLGVPWRDSDPFTFSGWVYVPSYIPLSSNFSCGDPYRGASATVTARDQWVPFCSTPSWDASNEDGWTARYPAVSINNFQAGWQFWVSEPCMTTLPFKHMPFNGLTPDVKDPGDSVLIDHRSTATQMRSYRIWTPRNAVVRQGQVKRVARWRKRSDGLLELSEPIKGGPLVPNLPATAISSYPAGKTIAEL